MIHQKYQNILIEKEGYVGILTINRPQKLNAINHETAIELCAAVRDLNDDKEVRAIVVKSSGNDFGSGEDIAALESDSTRPEGDKLSDHFCNIFETLEDAPKPITAAWQGRAIGGSYCMLYYCDTIVASEDARFQSGTINLGYTNVWRMKRMERCVGTKKAFEWIMSGDWISAIECEKYGFVNSVVPRQELDAAALQMATRFANKSPLAMQVSKEGWIKAKDMSIKDSEAYLLALRESRLRGSEDYQEGLAAKREKREPVWKGR
ncbi:enoyl-CoA hydratase/isomerase family protein [Thermodesulfobacteriota bacterium]